MCSKKLSCYSVFFFLKRLQLTLEKIWKTKDSAIKFFQCLSHRFVFFKAFTTPLCDLDGDRGDSAGTKLLTDKIFHIF